MASHVDAAPAPFGVRIAAEIWERKYRLKAPDGTPLDQTWSDTVARVARAVAAAEKGRKARAEWAGRYAEAIGGFEFLPAGRILAGAGAGRDVTLFNCFVMGTVPDDLGGIFEAVKEAALTMQAGGGVGMDFSTLRPKGALVRSIGADASGPVSFMDVWDAMCRTIMSAGARRGAMMATLSADHPDIEAFIAAKSDPARLRNFNLSVLVPDAFMAAVRDGRSWDLVFAGKVVRTVDARTLWDRLMRATYDYAEPGVIFIDRVNALDNLAYCETIRATNPCGEQPLPPYGACLLGSLNLARLVARPFSAAAALDEARLADRAATAVRFLDAAIDVSRYPLAAQRHEARAKRRIGLGVTGLADALVQCGVRYGTPEAAALAGRWMEIVQRAAYRSSAALAAEKGAFPLYDAEAVLARPNVLALDAETRAAVAASGLRNGCLTSIAPTGTISLLAGNVSSGVEPIFDLAYRRRIVGPDGVAREEMVEDEAYRAFRALHGAAAPLPAAFVRAADLAPEAHLVMQAAVQRHVDSAISKTINCAPAIAFEDFKSVYTRAFELGLKGCTTFRPNAVTGSVLSASDGAGASASNGPERPAADGALLPRPAAAAPLPAEQTGGIVYMARPLQRDPVLQGATYKLKWPGSDHAIYVTINDIEQGGRRRPFEIFINTRNLEHFAWTVALTRMISAVFRRGGDVTFVAEELKAVFDPQGGQWMAGRYVPSLLAAIGDVIEQHMSRIGFRAAPSTDLEAVPREDRAVGPAILGGDRDRGAARAVAAPTASASPGNASERGVPAAVMTGASPAAMPGAGPAHAAPPVRPHHLCPRCASPEFSRREGCWTCATCGYSRCA